MKALFTFFGLAYLISWATWLPLYGPIFGITSLPQLPFHHALGGLGPFMAAFLTTGIFFGKEGIISLLTRCLKFKPILFLLIALVGPFVLLAMALVTNTVLNGSSINFPELFTNREFPQFNLITIFFYNLFFFGFGEETGWRGFALPILQKNFNALVSSLTLTVFWAAWHIPLFFYRPGYTTMDAAGIAGWVFSLLTGSVLLTWLHNSTKSSILICAIFHSTIDIVFTSGITNKDITNYLGFLITVWGILIIILFKPKNLSLVDRVEKG